MARQKTSKFEAKDVLPIWSSSNITFNNAMFVQVLNRLGITDMGSYFRELWPVVAMGVFICAVGGAINFGITGLLPGAVAGLAAPAVLIWLGITLFHIFVQLFVFAAAWAAIAYCVLYVIRWWL